MTDINLDPLNQVKEYIDKNYDGRSMKIANNIEIIMEAEKILLNSTDMDNNQAEAEVYRLLCLKNLEQHLKDKHDFQKRIIEDYKKNGCLRTGKVIDEIINMRIHGFSEEEIREVLALTYTLDNCNEIEESIND